MHPNAPDFIIFICLMPDNVTHQGESVLRINGYKFDCIRQFDGLSFSFNRRFLTEYESESCSLWQEAGNHTTCDR